MERTHSHAQQTLRVVLQGEVFVRERLRTEDADAARSVAVEEVAALDHEGGYLCTSGLARGGSGSVGEDWRMSGGFLQSQQLAGDRGSSERSDT